MFRGYRSPWGYKIDYDKEIAEDRKLISEYEAVLAVRRGLPTDLLAALDKHLPGSQLKAWDVLLEAHRLGHLAEVSALFRLDQELALDLIANTYDWDHIEPAIPERSPGSYRRSDETGKALEWYEHGLEEVLKTRIKKAKASLSRHLRNKERNG